VHAGTNVYQFGLLLTEMLFGAPQQIKVVDPLKGAYYLESDPFRVKLAGFLAEWNSQLRPVEEEGSFTVTNLLKLIQKMTVAKPEERLRYGAWKILTAQMLRLPGGLAYDPAASSRLWNDVVTAYFAAHPDQAKEAQLSSEVSDVSERVDHWTERRDEVADAIETLEKLSAEAKTKDQKTELKRLEDKLYSLERKLDDAEEDRNKLDRLRARINNRRKDWKLTPTSTPTSTN